ncbi:MAG TPA: YeeE/YedE thiosulfate transporter family protein [Polyangia bacterium]
MSFIARVCPWPLAGLLVGLLAVGLQWVDNLPLGATGAAGGFLGWARRPAAGAGWRTFFFVGMLLGGCLYALFTHSFRISWAYPGLDARLGGALAPKVTLLLAGGLLIGFGARWAGGCTSGHGICGVGRLQAGSLLATATFVVTAVAVAHLVWGMGGR